MMILGRAQPAPGPLDPPPGDISPLLTVQDVAGKGSHRPLTRYCRLPRRLISNDSFCNSV